MAKYLKVKSQSQIALQWAIRMQKEVIYSERLDKTESFKKKLTAQCLRRKFEGVGV